MKVLAFNSSAMMAKGNTQRILGPFLEGMGQEGAEVELFFTKKLTIKPCQGEFHCWHKHPGKCFQKDDMQMLLPKLSEADVWVFGTPVYTDGVSGPLKMLLDRTIPLVQPFFELRDGHCRHTVPEGHKYAKVVLVSSCGFWEMDNFDPLLVHLKAYCKNASKEFAGALLRSCGGILGAPKEFGLPIDEILHAASEAGRQLVKDGKMAAETLDSISRELVPQEMYVQIVNQSFQQAQQRWAA